MKKNRLLTEICGWYGVLALLGAYVCLTFGIFEPTNLSYQILNVTGALGIVADAVGQKNWQPAVLNVIWALVGVIAVINIIR